jgi:hypothetical protein
MLKFNFSNYLMVVEGINYDYFDSNYDGIQADNIINGYNNYNLDNWKKDVEAFFDDNYDDDYNISYVKKY